MWIKFSKAEVLIYLDAQLETIARRQHRSDWTQARLDAQHQRLSDARTHCDLYVSTDPLTPDQVADRVEAFLREHGITPYRSSGSTTRH